MKDHGLTEAERAELYRLHRQQGYDSKAADKIKAILMLDKGYSQQEISEVLLRDEDTITRWKKTYRDRKSLIAWLDDEYTGYSGKLTPEQLSQVNTFVEANLIQSAETVQRYILEQFQVPYTISGIQALLHRLEFVYKQTTQYPSKMNPENQAWFKKMYELAEQNLDKGSVTLFLDAVHPRHNTHSTRVWVKKGQNKFIPANTGRKHLNINGAYNPYEPEVVIHEDETVNAETTLKLFQKILARYPDKETIYAIRDNAPYYRSKLVREFLRDSPIKLIPLPTYSPNLNLIERLWKLMRKKVINLCFYPTFAEFKEAVLGFFENFDDHKQEAMQFVGTNLRLIQPLAV